MAQSNEHLFSRNAMAAYWKDGDYSTLTSIDEWVDMRDYEYFGIVFTAGNLTGAGVKSCSIIADSDSDGGSGSNVTIKTWSGTVGSAEGDYLVLEVSAENIRQLAVDNSVELRYVTAAIQLANAADEAAIFYIRSGAKYATTGLTADVVT